MPELPEVETVKRTLQPLLEGKTFIDLEVRYGGIIKNKEQSEFTNLIKGRKIEKIDRRGKYLVMELSGGYSLIIHLRMTGQLVVTEAKEPITKHTHLVFGLSGGNQLRYIDIRKFGMVFLVPTGQWQETGGLAKLGPEPLTEEFTIEVLSELLSKRKGALKIFLLDQSNIAGIGNIYADEIMFAAGLHPQRSIETLDGKEIQALYTAIREKLNEGIDCRGTSVRDYVDGRGEKGGFQEKLQVYNRKGQPCLRCGTVLERKVVAGRGTVLCPGCQH